MLKRNVDYASARVRINEQLQRIPTKAREFKSKALFQVVLKVLNIHGEGLLPLITDIDSQEAFEMIMDDCFRAGWRSFTGSPVEMIGISMATAKKPFSSQIDRLQRRLPYWFTEGYKRLATLPKHPTQTSTFALGIERRKSTEPRPEMLSNPDAILGRDRAAKALGISTRTLDRWVVDKKLTPIGAGGRKLFKSR